MSAAPRRVAVLPDALANQIAAGEVVERPASVVKELVENAIDAEAQRIVVEIEDAGRELIRVVDDGVGMSRDDAVTSVRRHATSKIARVEDLYAIGTLGFRGEAVPSIASVSHFVMATRPHDNPVGTELIIHGGSEPVVSEAGVAPGTRVEVRELFFNTPARLKFMKRPATEITHVKALVTAFALGNPHVHFRLVVDGRTALEFPVARRLEHRVFQVFGKAAAERMHAVRFEGGVKVLGFLSEPRFTRTGRKGIHTFVNGRAVSDRTIDHAVISAFGTLLERGRYPHAVLYLHLPAADVDVNVHPAKAEVRFVRAGEVHEAVVRACRGMLMQQPWLGGRDGARAPGGAPLEGLWTSRSQSAASTPYEARWRAPAPHESSPPGSRSDPPPRSRELVGRSAIEPAASGVFGRSDARPGVISPALATPVESIRDGGPLPRPGVLEGAEHAAHGHFARLRHVGDSRRSYIVAEDDAGLYLIDRTAAARAIAFGILRAELTGVTGRVADRPLMFPAQRELTKDDVERLAPRTQALERLGVIVEPFGGATWQVVSVPACLSGAEPWELVWAAVDAVDVDGRGRSLDAAAAAIAALAPTEAIERAPAADVLRALDESGAAADGGATGRVVHRLPFDALARHFSEG